MPIPKLISAEIPTFTVSTGETPRSQFGTGPVLYDYLTDDNLVVLTDDTQVVGNPLLAS